MVDLIQSTEEIHYETFRQQFGGGHAASVDPAR
jgi:septin family protein